MGTERDFARVKQIFPSPIVFLLIIPRPFVCWSSLLVCQLHMWDLFCFYLFLACLWLKYISFENKIQLVVSVSSICCLQSLVTHCWSARQSVASLFSFTLTYKLLHYANKKLPILFVLPLHISEISNFILKVYKCGFIFKLQTEHWLVVCVLTYLIFCGTVFSYSLVYFSESLQILSGTLLLRPNLVYPILKRLCFKCK